MRSKKLIGWLGILISIAIIYWIFKTINFQEVWETLLQAKPIYLLITGLAFLLTPFIRAIRWQWMLPNNTSYLGSVVLGFAGNNVLPARGGELVRMEYFHQKNPTTNRITIISSIATAKLLDAFCLILLLLFSLSQLKLEEQVWINNITRVAIPVVGILLILILYIRIRGNSIKIYLSQFQAKYIKTVIRIIDQVQQAILFLNFDRKTFFVLLATLGIWLAESVMFTACLLAFDVSISIFWLSIFTMCIVNFGIATPSSPGFFGIFQAATLLALTPFGIPEQVAVSIGLMVNCFQFLPLTIWGLVIFLRWRK